MKTQTISQLYVSKKAEVSKRDRTFRQQIEEAKLKKQDFMPLWSRAANDGHQRPVPHTLQ